MKKSILSFGDAALTRSEMKSLRGGDEASDCKRGSCTLIFKDGNTWVTRHGTCALAIGFSAYWGGGGTCYCDAGEGVKELRTNKGVSYCRK